MITRDGKPVSLFFGTVPIIKLDRVAEGEPDAYTGPGRDPHERGKRQCERALRRHDAGRAGARRSWGSRAAAACWASSATRTFPAAASSPTARSASHTANGKRIEGEGVTPTSSCRSRSTDLRVGRDRALEEAQALHRHDEALGQVIG